MSVTSVTTLEQKISPAASSQTGAEIAVLLDADAGAMNTMYTISSTQEFVKVFGYADKSGPTFYDGYKKKNYYEWCKYLLNRGNVLRIVRAGVDTEGKTKASLSASATVGSQEVTFEAVGYGKYYNSIQISLVPSGNYFSLVVSYKPDAETEELLEKYPVCSLDPDSDYYIGNVSSNVITVTITGDYATGANVSATTALLSGASDVGDASAVEGGAATSSEVAYEPLKEFSDREFGFCLLLTFCAVHNDSLTGSALASAHIETLLAERQYDFVYIDTYAIMDPNSNVARYNRQADGKVKVPSIKYLIPASIPVADTIAGLHKRNLMFRAPAGIPNGVLTDVVSVEKIYSKEEIEEMQENAINPIVLKQGTGIVIWGQSTWTTNPLDVTRLSVRLLVDYLKRVSYQLSQKYIFMDHVETTWNQWKNEMEPYVRDIYNIGGLLNYNIICDRTIMSQEDIEAGIMRCQIIIQPPYQINEIVITFSIDESGISFE